MIAERPVARRRGGPLRAAGDLLIMARRNLLHVKSDPAQIAGLVIQPLLFLVLFVYVLGGAIAGSPERYLQFGLPGQIVLLASLAAVQAGQGLAADVQRGVAERLRSLPVSGSAVVGGRIAADLVRMVVAILLLTGFGMLLGFDPGNGVAGMLAGVAVAAAFGFVLCWPMAFLGIVSRSPDAVATWGFLVLLPLVFASSVLAPADSMPGWLASLVEVNPITAVADVVRGLMAGGPVARPMTLSMAWMVALFVIFAFLAIRRYRGRT